MSYYVLSLVLVQIRSPKIRPIQLKIAIFWDVGSIFLTNDFFCLVYKVFFLGTIKEMASPKLSINKTQNFFGVVV